VTPSEVSTSLVVIESQKTPKPCENHEYGGKAVRTTTCQWYIVHAEDDNSLVFRRIFCYPAKVRFHDMVAVQEWHLSIGFYPNLHPQNVRFSVVNKAGGLKVGPTNLVLGILGKVVESGYVQLEFSVFVEFTKTCPERDEIWSGYRDSETH